MPAIVFPQSSSPGRLPGEGNGRLINCYAVDSAGAERKQRVVRPVPGLDLATADQIGRGGGLRGLMWVGDRLYAVYDGFLGVVYRNSAGNYQVNIIGAIGGSNPVTIARNNRSPNPQVMIVGEDGAYVVENEVITSFYDSDVGAPTSVTFGSGYFFLTTTDGRIWATGINDTTVNGLDFAQAEANPDPSIRAIAKNNLLYVFGSRSLEVWSNTANAVGFPYSRANVSSRGLLSFAAVAGFEDGWADVLIYVADDRTIRMLRDYSPEKISTAAVDRFLSTVDETTLRACVYEFEGNPIWSLSSLTGTWEFNLSTGQWHERSDHNGAGWPCSVSAPAFGGWFFGSREGAKLYSINARGRVIDGVPLRWEAESVQGTAFPNRYRVLAGHFDVSVGVGDPAGSDLSETAPRVEVSWSDDGGATWTPPVFREVGPQGNYRKRISVRNAGRTGRNGRRWKVAMSDPYEAALFGGSADIAGGSE